MGKAFDVGLERLVSTSVDASVREEGDQPNSGEWRAGSGEAEEKTRTVTNHPSKLRASGCATQEENSRSLPERGMTRGPAESTAAQGVAVPQSPGQTFYLETFGCQMNEHDSEKVAGVLLARGYKQVEKADAADVILYNTCSIREKAAQKVFSRLGEWRPQEGGQRPATGDRRTKSSQLSVHSRQFQRRETQDPSSKSALPVSGQEDGTPEEQEEKIRTLTDHPSKLRASGCGTQGQEGAIPQGLKPGSSELVMPDLKVQPLMRRERGPIIGVLGCLAQQEGEKIFERAPWVSLVCGSASYRKLPQLIQELEQGNRRVTGLDTDTDETFETEITRRDNPWRAYLTIIEGCDKACSYCVVPFTRGPERSRTSESILAEVRQLADMGYSEVQLLGQTVNSYADPSALKMRFSELLVAVAEVPGIRRVRFTTSHPRDFGKDIVEAIDAVPGICEHVHLPVQSGSTKVLRAMARTYTREEYLEKVALMRAAKREINITTDVIVGFPGETQKDFEETLSLMEAVQYDGAFCFKYSPRPNTPSLKMEDAIPEEEKSRRLGILLEKQREIQRARNEKLLGKTFEVLVEGKSRRENQWSGHTSANKVMNFTSQREESLGDYVRVKVVEALPNSLIGEVAND